VSTLLRARGRLRPRRTAHARRTLGDDWIINGQKIWTSGAHFADFGIIVTRTDPNVPKHQGLTFFFLSMKSPGIEVQRIKQISGTSNFNEVLFTDVRVPDSQRLGKVGDGWKVSLTTLMKRAARRRRRTWAGFRRHFCAYALASTR
jgi:alkylation response protein AidB-like acyl-CoA dehydrogenase